MTDPKITKTEVLKAVKNLRTSKAVGIGNIPPEAIKALDDESVICMHRLLIEIWQDEHIQDDWRKGLYLLKPQRKVTSLNVTIREVLPYYQS